MSAKLDGKARRKLEAHLYNAACGYCNLLGGNHFSDRSRPLSDTARSDVMHNNLCRRADDNGCRITAPRYRGIGL